MGLKYMETISYIQTPRHRWPIACSLHQCRPRSKERAQFLQL